MKKIIISLTILIIAIIIGFIFLFPQYISSPINILNGKKSNLEKIIEDKQITDNTKPFSINIKYPFIVEAEDFNKKVQDIIEKEINSFKKNSLENDNAVKETDPVGYADYPREYNLTIGYDKGDLNDNTISIVFSIYSFEGGAHGTNYFIPLNYNLNTKQEIKLSDLFPNQTDYLKNISAYCTSDLTKQIIEINGDTAGSWIEDGASPIESNFSDFLINKDNIIFYFQQYQVSYGAAGSFKVTMPIMIK